MGNCIIPSKSAVTPIQNGKCTPVLTPLTCIPATLTIAPNANPYIVTNSSKITLPKTINLSGKFKDLKIPPASQNSTKIDDSAEIPISNNEPTSIIGNLRMKIADALASKNNYSTYEERFASLIDILKSEFGEDIKIKTTLTGNNSAISRQIGEKAEEIGNININFTNNTVNLNYKDLNGADTFVGKHSDGTTQVESYGTKIDTNENTVINSHVDKWLDRNNNAYDYFECIVKHNRNFNDTPGNFLSESRFRKYFTSSNEFVIEKSVSDAKDFRTSIIKALGRDGKIYHQTENIYKSRSYACVENEDLSPIKTIETEINGNQISENITQNNLGQKGEIVSGITDTNTYTGKKLQSTRNIKWINTEGSKIIVEQSSKEFWQNGKTKSTSFEKYDKENPSILLEKSENEFWEDETPKYELKGSRQEIDSRHSVFTTEEKKYNQDHTLAETQNTQTTFNSKNQPISETQTTETLDNNGRVKEKLEQETSFRIDDYEHQTYKDKTDFSLTISDKDTNRETFLEGNCKYDWNGNITEGFYTKTKWQATPQGLRTEGTAEHEKFSIEYDTNTRQSKVTFGERILFVEGKIKDIRQVL